MYRVRVTSRRFVGARLNDSQLKDEKMPLRQGGYYWKTHTTLVVLESVRGGATVLQ